MIHVENLTKKYGKRRVLDDLSFQIEPGQIVGLVGPNGMGKSTLLQALTNLLPVNKGTVTLNGMSNRDQAVYQTIGFMQDNTTLYEHLTGYDHMKFICDMQDIDVGLIQATAQLVGNEAYLNKRVGEYSLGMKQHLLFACAILNQPTILFLDEPFNGLDPTSLIRIRNLMVRLNQERGMTIFLSSHDLDEISRMTDTIFFLKDGKILDKNLKDYHKVVYELELASEGQALLHLPQVKWVSNQLLMVEDSHLNEVLNQLSQQAIQIQKIRANEVQLEALYKEIYQIN